RTDCWLLCDISNIYANSFNLGYDPIDFLEGVPSDRVVQFHLAGQTYAGTHIVDTHDRSIAQETWRLYELAIERFGPVSTIIERDENIPPLGELMEELARARAIAARSPWSAKFGMGPT